MLYEVITGDFHFLLGKRFQDRKHHVLFAHRARVFDLELFGELSYNFV